VLESVFGICFCHEVKWGVCKPGLVTTVCNACRITNWTFRVYWYLAIFPSFSIYTASRVWSTLTCVYPESSIDVSVLNFACLSLWPGYMLYTGH
jgi:hypothetical protein